MCVVSNSFADKLILSPGPECQVNVPAIGPSGRLTSYFGAIKALTKAREMLEEGYKKVRTSEHRRRHYSFG